MTLKRCYVCGEQRDLEKDFYIRKRRDGVEMPITVEGKAECKECTKKRVARNYAIAQAKRHGKIIPI